MGVTCVVQLAVPAGLWQERDQIHIPYTQRHSHAIVYFDTIDSHTIVDENPVYVYGTSPALIAEQRACRSTSNKLILFSSTTA